MSDVTLILASSSPRRRQLLEEAGYRFEVDPSDFDEPGPDPDEPAAVYVARMAWSKARSVATRRGEGLVLGADTACEVDGEILGKPVDRADAVRMLSLQDGREIEVVTGLCLMKAGASEWVGAVEVGVCRFRAMDEAERTAYLDSGRWRGKAGGYGVQDPDPVATIVRGTWSNVVGLPIERLAELLRDYPGLTRRP